MSNDLTRVDPNLLAPAVARALELLREARTVLAPVLVSDLSAEERASVPRAPAKLADAARDLVVLAQGDHAQLAEAIGFDAEAVLEDVTNHEALAGLATLCAELETWVDDSRLVWLGEAYTQSRELYQAVKPLAQRNGALRTLVTPMAEVFANRRGSKTKTVTE